jgi:hypothetical protein
MARKRRGRSFSEARQRVNDLRASLDSGELSGEQELKVKLDLSDAQESFDKFKRSIDESAKSWGRSFAGFTGAASGVRGLENTVADWGNMSMPGGLGALANQLAPGSFGANFVGAAREQLGNLDAATSGAARLGGIATAFAREGMPLDDKFIRSLAPIIEGQEREAAKGRRIASDAFGDRTSDELGDAIYKIASDGYGLFRRMIESGGIRVR